MIQKNLKQLQAGFFPWFIFILILSFIYIFFHLGFVSRIYPGVKVAHLDLGVKTAEQASKVLKDASFKQEKALKLTHESHRWEIPLNQLSFVYLPETAGHKAFSLGRTGDLKKKLKERFCWFKGGINLDFDYQINQLLLEAAVASIAAEIDIPPIPPTIKIIKNEGQSKIEIQTGQSGTELDQKGLLEAINNRLGQLLYPDIILPVKKIQPEISQEQAEKTKLRAEKLLGKTLTIVAEENSWQLTEAELISFLDFDNDYDQQKIASYTAQLAESIDRPPQNALFNFVPAPGGSQNGRVIEFKPAKKGHELDQEKTKIALNLNLKNLEEEKTNQAVLNLEIKLTDPDIGTEDVNNLGIKGLIGRGESWFAGSISARIHNIQLASSLINGLLIPPGETFSLNQALGDVSEATGFKQAWVIKEGRTVLDDGGGVCQVSTTLFRAVLNAGLPIIERRAHAYRVAYYEQNYQVGVDATVFSPSPDLKFKNDTPAHILIQTYVDPATNYAHYDLYGTGDGRTMSISPSRIWNQTPPPPDLYQDDPTLPVGVVKQIDWSAWGAQVAFDWKVIRNNEVLQERTFYSNYKPWQAIFLRGTAGQ